METKKKPKAPPKTIPNPERVEYDRKRRCELYELGAAQFDYPEDFGKKLPDDGAWIITLMNIRVGRLVGTRVSGKEGREGERVEERLVEEIEIPYLSVYFAVPTMTTNSGLHQAIIQTPKGSVHVWPHEYNLFDLEKFLQFSDEDGFNIHFLSETGGFDEAALFYIRSRGISKAEAQRMLLPTLKDPNYCYFTFHESLREFFPEGTGTPYLMPHNHKRRAEARRRRSS